MSGNGKFWYDSSLPGRRFMRNVMRRRHRLVTGHYKIERGCPHNLSDPALPVVADYATPPPVQRPATATKPLPPNRRAETPTQRRNRRRRTLERETSLRATARFT